MKISVYGTSAFALALCIDLRLRGAEVTVSAPDIEQPALSEIEWQSGIMFRVTGSVEGLPDQHDPRLMDGFRVASPEDAADADIIVLMFAANHLETVLERIAGRLRKHQVVLLCPSGVGAPLLVARAVGDADRMPLVGQACAMPFACFTDGPGTVNFTARKRQLVIGAYPANRTQELLDRINPWILGLVPARNVVDAALHRIGIGMHPVSTLMNAVNIENRGSYIQQHMDVTPSVGAVIDAVDSERMAVLRAFGAEPSSFPQILEQYYGVHGSTFYETVKQVDAFSNAPGAPSLSYRYVSEDVPTQMVPAAELGKAIGVPTPAIDSVITLTSIMNRTDYRREGWTLESLGLAGRNLEEVLAVLSSGFR